MGDTESTETGGTEKKQPHIPTRPFKRGSGAKAYVDTDTLVAELDAGAHEKPAGKGGKPAPKAKPAAAAPPEEREEEDEKPAETEDEDGKGDDGETEEEDQADDEEDEKPADTDDEETEDGEEEEGQEAELSPAQKAKLKGLQRAEMKHKAQVAKDQAEIEKQRTEVDRIVSKWQPKIERFEKLAAKARFDPVGVLEELGLGPDDFEPAARSLYAHSTKGAKDPKHRETIAEAQRRRERDAELDELRKEVRELKEGNAQEKQTAEVEARIATFLGKVEKAAKKTTDAPLVQKMLATKPEKARQRLYATANRLADEMGGVPDALDVIEALEAERLEELEEMGIDPATVLAEKKPAPKPDGKKPARTLRPAGGGSRSPAPKKPQNRDALFAEIADELEAGKDQENRLQ